MRRWILTTLLVAAPLAFTWVLDAQQAPPDIVLTNGKIVTVDDRFSIAQAVAIRGDRFVAVASNQDITRIFRENDLGSIQNGRLADLVVTDRDYLTVPADQIKDIKPVMTMVGGRVVWDAAIDDPTATR